MKISMSDIAERAGVSLAAVSLVLNNKPSRISLETRRRIIRIARECNYVPNHVAVSLATNRTKTIGLIVPSMGDIYFNNLAMSIERYAYDHGFMMNLCNIDDSSEKCFEYLNNLLARCVDGIIIIPPSDINENENNGKLGKFFDSASIPILLLDSAVYYVFCDYVAFDNKAGGEMAASYLIRHGHRNIGYISGPLGTYSAKNRLEGYLSALESAGIPKDDHLIYFGDYRLQSGYEGMRELCNNPDMTAIVSANDLMAYGVYQYAAEHHIVFPRDLSIISIGNTYVNDILPVPLTSVNVPQREMGEKACEMLLYRIANTNSSREYEDIFFPPSLVERSSVASV